MVRNGNKIIYWSPDRTGDWAFDNSMGAAYAEELISFMRKHENPVILGRVASDTINGSVFSGVEVGFCTRLAWHLMR